MENIARIFNDLLNIINSSQKHIFGYVAEDVKFNYLLNDLTGSCSNNMGISDYMSLLIALVERSGYNPVLRHKETKDEYIFFGFSVRTSKKNKGIDCIYGLSVNAHKIYFTKNIKDFMMNFETDIIFLDFIILAAAKAESICYTSKGFPRTNTEGEILTFLGV